MSNTQNDVARRTEACLKSIKTTPELSPVILVLGKTGVGKSSLIECITGATGMSGTAIESVTTRCEIASDRFYNREYFFIDTPGFEDSDNAQDIFLKIMETIVQIRENITIEGVWYVVDNSRSRDSKFDSKLIEWLQAFCGEGYCPYVTFVTTHWGCKDADELNVLQLGFDQRKIVWENILGRDFATYQHGKRYRNEAETSDVPTLSWHRNQGTLRWNARDLVRRSCRVLHGISPCIMNELENGVNVVDTAAGHVFSPFTQTPRSQKETSTAEEININHQSDAGWLSKATTWFLDNVAIEITPDGVSICLGGARVNVPHHTGSNTNSNTNNGDFDPHSVVDAFKLRGMDSSLPARARRANDLGVTTNHPPGSVEHNMATHKALLKAYPI